MRYLVNLFLLTAAIATATAILHSPSDAAVGCRGGHPRLAGHYALNGVMEVGSEIVLRKDGSFEFMLAYGANDQYGKGCWVQDGATVSLVPAGRPVISGSHTPDSTGFEGMVLRIDGDALLWDIGGSGRTGRYEK